MPRRYSVTQSSKRLRLTIGPIQITTGPKPEIRWSGQVRPLPEYRGHHGHLMELVLDRNGVEIFVRSSYFPIPIPLGPNPKIEIENLENFKAPL